MAKRTTRPTYNSNIPKARTPIDPFNPNSIGFNPQESLETNEGEVEKSENRTEIVKQTHAEKFKRSKQSEK